MHHHNNVGAYDNERNLKFIDAFDVKPIEGDSPKSLLQVAFDRNRDAFSIVNTVDTIPRDYCLNIIAKLPYCREVPIYHEPLIAIVVLEYEDWTGAGTDINEDGYTETVGSKKDVDGAVLNLVKCAEDDKVKFAMCTFEGRALTCAFGTVVDVFIPFKKSQAGKRFAFVRFIKVFNLERLVKNLCTIWIGRYHLYANQVRFERPNKPAGFPSNSKNMEANKGHFTNGFKVGNNSDGSYAHVVNGGSPLVSPATLISPSPALVLDETCLIDRDFSKCVMGKVKDVYSIPNIQTILQDEGFVDVKPKYLGGLWVMLECEKEESILSLTSHIGVNSWFQTIQEVDQDFVSDERIAWVDIEGVPIRAWSVETFSRIGKKWGELLNIEDTSVATFGRKRVCILTKNPVSILESFKIIVKGKVFMIRAKELFTWSPNFLTNKETECSSDDESVQSEMHILKHSNLSEEEEGEFKFNDVEGVAETIFDGNSVSDKRHSEEPVTLESGDPFKIYELLNKNKSRVESQVPSPSLSHPPGFSPVGHESKLDKVHENGEVNEGPGVDSLAQNDVESCNSTVETKMDAMSHMDVKFMWGNSNYDFVCSDSLGSSGGILCIWEPSIFKKDNVTISDNFVAIYGTWLTNNVKVLLISVYAPQQPAYKRVLWEYLSTLLGRWNGDVIIMGDFNEVRRKEERRGCQTGGLSHYYWSHPSATKMSKLDRFLVSDGIILLFPSITALCLDRHLSDHRPILLREILLDFGPTPFRFYHSWFSYDGFDEMVEKTWRSFSYSDTNGMIRFKKKLQDLKSSIRLWVKDKRASLSSLKHDIVSELREIDKELDSGLVSDEQLARRLDLKGQLHDINDKEASDRFQKSKVRWAIEGDENSSFFHGIINKKRSQLAIRGILVDGSWQSDPQVVKEVFRNHFAARFKKPNSIGPKINYSFPNRLSQEQVLDLEREVSSDEIRLAVWSCGDNKSPGPDGYTFEFFKKYWGFIGSDFCDAVEHFFTSGAFSKGCNSSFIALIPKVMDAKLVSDFRPISLIGCVYKVVTKILANRLSMVISNIVSNTQSAFVSERQILDGPFIINELLHWCKRKNKRAMFFKVDFAKAYDSVRWDYLIDVLEAFGFGLTWCQWIRGDPLAPLLFIFVMESLHLSISRVVEVGIFKGIRLNSSLSLSHLFYADDALIINVLKCFFLASGLQINIHKSSAFGVGVARPEIEHPIVTIPLLPDFGGVTDGTRAKNPSSLSDIHARVFPDPYLLFRLIMPPRRFKKKSVRKIVEKRVAKAIEKYEKTRADSNNTGGSGSTNTGGTVVPEMHGCSYKTFMNGKPHSFKGTEGVVGLKRWFEKMEQVFEICKCAEDDKVKFAMCTFEGRALTWWNGNVQTLGLANANQIPWSNVKAMMTTEYCPSTEIQRIEQELWTLTLKGDDIKAYSNRFQELVLMCPKLVSTESKKIEKYIRGFPERIKGNITSLKPMALHEAINMARKLVEQSVQGHMEKDYRVRLQGAGNDFLQNVTCFECGEKGHFKDKYPKAGNQQNNGARGRAYVVVENP
ncbi:RNA-directed DNA polymerase, eukaryota [Tanacetum coccineum]